MCDVKVDSRNGLSIGILLCAAMRVLGHVSVVRDLRTQPLNELTNNAVEGQNNSLKVGGLKSLAPLDWLLVMLAMESEHLTNQHGSLNGMIKKTNNIISQHAGRVVSDHPPPHFFGKGKSCGSFTLSVSFSFLQSLPAFVAHETARAVCGA